MVRYIGFVNLYKANSQEGELENKAICYINIKKNDVSHYVSHIRIGLSGQSGSQPRHPARRADAAPWARLRLSIRIGLVEGGRLAFYAALQLPLAWWWDDRRLSKQKDGRRSFDGVIAYCSSGRNEIVSFFYQCYHTVQHIFDQIHCNVES